MRARSRAMTFGAGGRARLIVAVLAATALAAGGWIAWKPDGAPSRRIGLGTTTRAAVRAACDLPVRILERMWRGYVPGRSGDVLAVERLPHQFGTRHSGPYGYTQRVPLVLYGPGFIRAGVAPTRAATVADIAPTLAELMRFDAFPSRDGRILDEALVPSDRRGAVPRVVVVVVWDGGGRNVLERWPRSWPVLRSLMESGTSYARATVGSSPSITPSVHATIGTGAWPSAHGISEVRVRVAGRIVDAWEDSSPRLMRLPTLADLWDSTNHDRPRVGLIARDEWHLGMMGRGAFGAGGDRDVAVLDDLESASFRTSARYYSLPGYLRETSGLRASIDEVDRRDGRLDGAWLGNHMLLPNEDVRYTPAWTIYQTRRAIEVLTKEGFGADEETDLFFINYKGTDLAGHQWNMIEPETRDHLAEQDHQLRSLIAALNHLIGAGRFVVVVTADHGMTPSSTVTRGWSIDIGRMTSDLERALGRGAPSAPIVLENRGYQLFLDAEQLQTNDLNVNDVIDFISNYRVADNAPGGDASGGNFDGPASARLFAGAFTPATLKGALECSRRRDPD